MKFKRCTPHLPAAEKHDGDSFGWPRSSRCPDGRLRSSPPAAVRFPSDGRHRGASPTCGAPHRWPSSPSRVLRSVCPIAGTCRSPAKTRHPRPTHPGRRHERGKDGRDSLFLRFCVSAPVFTSYVDRANVISRARLQLSVAVQLLHLWCHEEAVRTLRVMSARD